MGMYMKIGLWIVWILLRFLKNNPFRVTRLEVDCGGGIGFSLPPKQSICQGVKYRKRKLIWIYCSKSKTIQN